MKKRFLLLAAALIICVAALAIPASAADHVDHDGWTALTANTTTLNGDSYYLSGDVTASGVITISGNVTLCLNGHVLDLNGHYIKVSGSLTLCDCNSTKQTHKFTVGDDGLWTWDENATGDNVQTVTGGVITSGKGSYGGVYVNTGTFNMEGGNIIGNKAPYGGGVRVYDGNFDMSGDASISENTATNGGGVYVYDGNFDMYGDASISGNTATYGGGGVCVNFGTFNMEGGSIESNTATYGGGVFVQDGAFNMESGSISENTASSGGGVYVYRNGTFIMSGGSITGNKATFGGGVFLSNDGNYSPVLKLSGAPVIDGDIRLDSKPIEITAALSNTEPFQLTNVDGTFTSGWKDKMGDADPAKYFSIDKTDCHIGLSYDGEVIVLANTYTVTLHTDGGTISSGNITSYTYGIGATLPTDVERSGYRFDGWYASADFSGEPVTEITAADYGDKTFYAKWTRRASSPSYKTAVVESDGGSVTATPASAAKGLTVTVKIKPDEGFALGELTVTDAAGNELSLYKRSDTEYSFTMPGSAVSIEASFEAVGEPVEESEPLFADVRETDWHYDAVKYVCENGLMNGVSDEYFDPDATLTRSMMVTLLWRLAGEPVVNYLMPFDDVDQGSWYGEAVRWAASEKIVSGVSGDSYAPGDPITREQLAVILYRFAVYMGYDVSVGEDTNILSYEDFAEISEYAIPAIQWATGSGLMRGVTDSELSPQGTATRAQIATMMMRFIESI